MRASAIVAVSLFAAGAAFQPMNTASAQDKTYKLKVALFTPVKSSTSPCLKSRRRCQAWRGSAMAQWPCLASPGRHGRQMLCGRK